MLSGESSGLKTGGKKNPRPTTKSILITTIMLIFVKAQDWQIVQRQTPVFSHTECKFGKR